MALPQAEKMEEKEKPRLARLTAIITQTFPYSMWRAKIGEPKQFS